MKRTIALLFLLAFCFATAMQAQAPAPKPAPEVKKLQAVVGHWTYEGESKTGPLGPGGKFSGENDCQMILKGFFFECRWVEKWPAGEGRGREIDGYDPVNKNFSSGFYMDDGSTFSGVLTIAGNTWTYAGKWVSAGKQYRYKGTFIVGADSTSMTGKEEISVDGQTWTPWRDTKWIKAKPAAKK
jgi:hypothetical protein